ncbi:helix-turn-helix transcriptional regulator [Microbispora bryophytorum]|uniref:helix-turn-helix transcriptional regulator n=1 Tax=Microbispora bryophytorum TaxID=1460882 RepID=UPI0033CBE46F
MSDQLGTSDIARLLEVSRPRVWQLRKDPGFPQPAARDKQGREYWYEDQILRWVATTRRSLADKAPLLFRPTSGTTAYYLGTFMVDGFVTLTWDSELGRIAFVYSPSGFEAGEITHVLDHLLQKTGADTLIGMDSRFHDAWGPELAAVDAAHPRRHYTPRWTDLQQTLGMRVPYWPSGLTIPQEMTKWQPGTSPAVLPPRHPDLDTGPLLQMVSSCEDGSTLATAALHLAREIDAQAASGARSDIDLLEKAHDRDAITLAAKPLEVPETPDVDEWKLRDGWAQILNRTDDLAKACIALALQWDGGHYFPFATPTLLDPKKSPEAAELVARLRHATPTAAVEAFGHREVDTYWSDPATDLPVIITPNGEVWATVPQRLPALAPLSQIILRDRHVWIRTSDGMLYLAPQDGTGLTWGYRGGGPTTLAILLSHLLDDINAPAVRSHREGPPPAGLLKLIQGTEGGIFTRDQLQAACDDI